MKKNIAVIGAGNGGFAMAGDLTLAGYGINLFELPEFEHNILPVKDSGGIEITGPYLIVRPPPSPIIGPLFVFTYRNRVKCPSSYR